jgi:hypothetical protein
MNEKYQLLARAVGEFYSSDPTGAGVTTAWLPSKEQWYMSVVRYHGSYASQKEVVCSSLHTDPEECLDDLSRKWLICIGRGKAVDLLCQLVYG